jgi:hypothetical protein
MGRAVRNRSTGWIGGWSRYDTPAHDPLTEEIIECEIEDLPSLKPADQIDSENAPPVPEWVWMFQLRKALRRMLLDEDHPELGDALSTLEAYAANAGDEDLTDELSAATVRRDHGTVSQLAFLFQWTDARLDDAFRLAATL